MNRWVRSAMVSSVLSLGAPAHAAEEAQPPGGDGGRPGAPEPSVAERFRLGLRLGYSLPLGQLNGPNVVNADGTAGPAASIHDFGTGMVPIWLDAGYFVTPHVMLGLYGQYGFVTPPTRIGVCQGGDCTTREIRVGVQGQYHFSPEAPVDPWAGLGVGYELLLASDTFPGAPPGALPSPAQHWDNEYRCIEFANLQGGADFDLGGGVTVGPFGSASFGQCVSSNSGSGGQMYGWRDIPSKGTHEWLTVGAKGTFGL